MVAFVLLRVLVILLLVAANAFLPRPSSRW